VSSSSDARLLEDKVALVTGASRGIGQAIAVALAQQGARLALVARSVKGLRQTAHQVENRGAECLVTAADVANEAQVRRVVAEALERFGRVDILVNSAGVAAFRPLEETTEADWDAMLDANLKSPFLLMKHVVPLMVRQGKGDVVNIASIAALHAFSNSSGYCASKAGLVGLSRAVSQEYRTRGIRVVAVCPGAVDTPLWDAAEQPPERSRMLRPEEVAKVVVAALTFSDTGVVDLLQVTPRDGIL
jgi:NAD(P)-dependent dehydrogenase (short-subunit alcohol dehydrogenase family)